MYELDDLALEEVSAGLMKAAALFFRIRDALLR